MNPDRFPALVEQLVALTAAARPLTAARLASAQVAVSALTVRIIGLRMRGA
jgi:hypothetical protein